MQHIIFANMKMKEGKLVWFQILFIKRSGTTYEVMKQPKCHIFAFDFHFNEVVAFREVILSIITSSLDVNATKGKENLIISKSLFL